MTSGAAMEGGQQKMALGIAGGKLAFSLRNIIKLLMLKLAEECEKGLHS